MKKGIANLTVGDKFEGFLLINEATKGTTSNGKPFLTLMLRDESGELEAKLWDATKEDEENLLAEQIIHVTGDINQFRGKKSIADSFYPSVSAYRSGSSK